MITVMIYGIDPYLARQISREMSSKLAQVYETDSDNIMFYAPDGLLVHEGYEQNTWNIFVTVNAPERTKIFEKNAVEVIKKYLKHACVHFTAVFNYYSQESRYEVIDEQFPKFMNAENNLYVESEEDYSEDEEHDHEHYREEEIYLGNAFEEFNKRNKGE